MRRFDINALSTTLFEHVNGGAADICVIVPLYNYEDYISLCLQSVILQTLSSLSLVIVDDHSNDRGADLAIELLEANKDRFISSRVIRHRRNQGLAMARNSGIQWSTEPFLFMLDADNALRPPALSRLLEALLISRREFAYSQLHMLGGEGGVTGVADVWDPRLFEFCNYIDGMALIKRTALLAVGGYRASSIEQGWEDFDLWCKFAELGFNGVYLPELLCEYRVHDASMLKTSTDRLRRSLSLEMTLRHPTVFRKHSIPEFVDYFPPDPD